MFPLPANSQCIEYNNILVAACGYSNESTGTLSLDYHYMLVPWFGIGGGVTSSFQSNEDILPNGDYLDDPSLHWSSETKLTMPCIKLSALFRPVYISAGKYQVNISLEPGVLFSPLREVQTIKTQNVKTGVIEYVKISEDADKWISWIIVPGISVQKDRIGFGVAYCLSSLDSFSTARTLSFEGCSFEKFYPTYNGLFQSFQIYTSFFF